MNTKALIDALELPPTSRIDQRVTKKMLLENGAPTAADKRLIQEGIQELIWVAALKPTTIGVAAHEDPEREYLEIIIIHLTMRAGAKANRLVTLVHRAVPYPVVLVTEQAAKVGFTMAHKRRSQAHPGKTVLDGEILSIDLDAEHDGQHWPSFRAALALKNQPNANLHALYQGWLDVLHALQAARVTGAFCVVADALRAAARRDALQEYTRIVAAMKRIRTRAKREKQMNRRVEVNLELQRMEAALHAIKERL